VFLAGLFLIAGIGRKQAGVFQEGHGLPFSGDSGIQERVLTLGFGFLDGFSGIWNCFSFFSFLVETSWLNISI
jgi:hypothetical protein